MTFPEEMWTDVYLVLARVPIFDRPKKQFHPNGVWWTSELLEVVMVPWLVTQKQPPVQEGCHNTVFWCSLHTLDSQLHWQSRCFSLAITYCFITLGRSLGNLVTFWTFWALYIAWVFLPYLEENAWVWKKWLHNIFYPFFLLLHSFCPFFSQSSFSFGGSNIDVVFVFVYCWILATMTHQQSLTCSWEFDQLWIFAVPTHCKNIFLHDPWL